MFWFHKARIMDPSCQLTDKGFITSTRSVCRSSHPFNTYQRCCRKIDVVFLRLFKEARMATDELGCFPNWHYNGTSYILHPLFSTTRSSSVSQIICWGLLLVRPSARTFDTSSDAPGHLTSGHLSEDKPSSSSYCNKPI